jgi:hypothetical protein
MYPLPERPITPSALILDEPVLRRIRITWYSAKNSYARGFGPADGYLSFGSFLGRITD